MEATGSEATTGSGSGGRGGDDGVVRWAGGWGEGADIYYPMGVACWEGIRRGGVERFV